MGLMGRMTTNKGTSDMSMTQLARNACYIKEGKVRYRDYDMDVDARELARKLLRDYAAGDDAFTDDEDFDEQMTEYLMHGINDIEGLVAAFYRNLWAMAEIHEHLKRYEDLGERGRLLELPCAVGDIVYRINAGARIPVIGMVVTEIRYKALRSGKIITKLMVSDDIAIKTNGCSVYYSDEIGEKIFLTKEAAESTLKEMSE